MILLENVRKWYRSDKDTDIELLEKANIKDDDILYEYFRDNWVKWEQIESRVPHNFSGRTGFRHAFRHDACHNMPLWCLQAVRGCHPALFSDADIPTLSPMHAAQ